MSSISSLARTASLVGEPARAAMLVALMDGRALSAGELASAAGITPPTASGHLAGLLDAGLLAVERQGRHRYYRLASPAVGTMIEGLMSVGATIAADRKPIVTGPRDEALRTARICYDHLAGTVAVAIADRMIERGHVDMSLDGAAVTASGLQFLHTLDIDLAANQRRKGAVFCRPCLDWSERRPHLAGAMGRALYQTLLSRHWLRRVSESRAVSITPPGVIALERHFGVRMAG